MRVYTMMVYAHDGDENTKCRGCGNGADCHHVVRFASKQEAEDYARGRSCWGLAARWGLV